MRPTKSIGKREFIQHTSKYIKLVSEQGNTLVITHQNQPVLVLSKIKPTSLSDLRGTISVTVHGDINEHVLPGYDEW